MPFAISSLFSGVIYFYEKYGELINVVQKVNCLPHERYVVDDNEEERSNLTRSLARRTNANRAENVRNNVSQQVLLLITRLGKDLRDQVFSQSDKQMNKDTRLITDLKSTAVRIKSRGAIRISNIERAQYITTLPKIISTIKEVPYQTITHQFDEFMIRLEQVVKTKRMMISTAKSLSSYFCAVTKSCRRELR